MSYDNTGRTTRPPSRSSSSAPMGSTVAIVVTAIAVLLAFFILRKVNDSGETSSVDPGTIATTATTLLGDTSLTTIAQVTVTTSGIVKIGTSVQVVNCSNQEGVARNLSNALGAEGFTMTEPDTGTIDLPVTKIIYNPDDPLALPVAQTVSLLLAGAVIESSGPAVPSLIGAWLPGSSVMVLLGDDLAGKTLAQIAGVEPTGTTAPATSAP